MLLRSVGQGPRQCSALSRPSQVTEVHPLALASTPSRLARERSDQFGGVSAVKPSGKTGPTLLDFSRWDARPGIFVTEQGSSHDYWIHRRGQPRAPIAAKPGRPGRIDYEYERNGTANIFMLFAPLEGWRHVEVTDRHTAVDYAHLLKQVSDTWFPKAPKIALVQDNLSTHKPASLYEAFPAAEARRLLLIVLPLLVGGGIREQIRVD